MQIKAAIVPRSPGFTIGEAVCNDKITDAMPLVGVPRSAGAGLNQNILPGTPGNSDDRSGI
jgi:hypothetical protein